MRRSDRKTVITASLVGLAMAAGSAQDSQPWFGLELPTGLGDPHRPVVNVGDVGRRRSSWPPAKSAMASSRARESGGTSRRSSASRSRVGPRAKGVGAGHGISGGGGHDGVGGAAVQGCGPRARGGAEYEASAPMWWSRSWEVRLLGDARFGPGSEDVVLESAVPTSGSQIAGGTLTAPLVHVGAAPKRRCRRRREGEDRRPASEASIRCVLRTGPHDRARARSCRSAARSR